MSYYLSNNDRESPKEHYCEIILKSVDRFSMGNYFKFFFIIIILALAAILFKGPNGLSNFDRGSFNKYSCKTISESIYRLRSRNHFKVFRRSRIISFVGYR